MSRAQLCLYAEGSGMNTEYQEEEGGRHWGAVNCSKFTVHSVGRNAEGFFFRTTSAHVGLVAMVQLTTRISLTQEYGVYRYSGVSVSKAQYSWYSGIQGKRVCYSHIIPHIYPTNLRHTEYFYLQCDYHRFYQHRFRTFEQYFTHENKACYLVTSSIAIVTFLVLQAVRQNCTLLTLLELFNRNDFTADPTKSKKSSVHNRFNKKVKGKVLFFFQFERTQYTSRS